MSSLNKVFLIGRLGKDPEIRYMPNGDAVANFSMATGEEWTDKTGERRKETEWHACVAFRKTAEVIGEWVKKGALIYAEGRIKTEKWTDKDGADRYSTKIYVDRIQMLGGKKDSEENTKTSAAPKDRGASGFDDLDDDIPL